MEQILLHLEQERESVAQWQAKVVNVHNLVSASLALADALRASQRAQQLTTTNINAEWLLNICATVPSELRSVQLARAIWSAAQLTEEAQQQAALFDALGEDGMDALFDVAAKLPQIRHIPENELKEDANDNSMQVFMDPEEERRQLLLQEAHDAAQVAAILKAEAESLGPTSGGTHSVARISDIQAQKAARKAAKRAETAMQAARNAGAIVDLDEFISVAQDAALGSGGLIGQSQEEIWALQHSLAPEGSRQYYEKKGLPSGTETEYGEGYEKVTIPAPIRDESKLPKRLQITDIMDSTCAQAFEGTSSLNPMQSHVFDTAFHRRDNMLVCAPTGAGKTNVAMLTVVAHFRDVGLIPGKESGGMETGGKKVVCTFPIRYSETFFFAVGKTSTTSFTSHALLLLFPYKTSRP